MTRAPILAVLLALSAAAPASAVFPGSPASSASPRPRAASRRCRSVIDRCEVVLAGNHDLFVVGRAFDGLAGGWAAAARFAHEQLGLSGTTLPR